MNQLEENIVNSFRLAKNDIMALQKKMTELSQAQERMLEILTKMKEKKSANSIRNVISVRKAAKKTYVASKTGSVVHDSNCPFAKNIKPASKVTFKSKNRALNKGYKLCECLKK